jgi:hypothetical protein
MANDEDMYVASCSHNCRDGSDDVFNPFERMKAI